MVFIVVDGLDASGKSTQTTLLRDSLKRKGKTVCVRLHPSSDNFLGVKTRQFLYRRGKSAHFTSAFFYMLDVIRSILLYSWQKYDYIIFVRYLMGTAYLPHPMDRIAYTFFSSIVPKTRNMFFLDISPEEANRRIRQTRSRLEMFENLGGLRKTRYKAVYLAMTDNWKIIRADRPRESVHEEILRYLQLLDTST